MSKWLEKIFGSPRFWIFVVVCAYLLYAVYYTIEGLDFSIGLISDDYVYNLISKNPWWWGILYYGSEGILNLFASLLRVIAGVFASYSAFIFWRRKDRATPMIREKVSKALLFEAGHYLSFFLSIITSFVYFFSNKPLYYFDHTPGPIFLYVSGIPLLAMIIFIPPLLLKTRSVIRKNSTKQEIMKWICLTSVSYLFVVFWFNYSMAWAGVLVPYEPLQHGISFLMKPPHLLSFIITVFGLFSLAMFALISTLPTIRRHSPLPNLKHIGVIIMSLGGYFVFHVFYYYLTGGYGAHPSVWYEIIGPLHNPDLWCISFVFLGLAILIRSNKQNP